MINVPESAYLRPSTGGLQLRTLRGGWYSYTHKQVWVCIIKCMMACIIYGAFQSFKHHNNMADFHSNLGIALAILIFQLKNQFKYRERRILVFFNLSWNVSMHLPYVRSLYSSLSRPFSGLISVLNSVALDIEIIFVKIIIWKAMEVFCSLHIC